MPFCPDHAADWERELEPAVTDALAQVDAAYAQYRDALWQLFQARQLPNYFGVDPQRTTYEWVDGHPVPCWLDLPLVRQHVDEYVNTLQLDVPAMWPRTVGPGWSHVEAARDLSALLGDAPALLSLSQRACFERLQLLTRSLARSSGSF